jgi:hypothetical protein
MANTIDDYRGWLRAFLKDHADKNRLLEFTEENTDDEIDLYLNMALGFLNFIPPFIQTYSYADFPIPTLVIHQATIECLISNGICHARNELTYNNGGVSLKISDGDRYLRMLQQLYRMADLEINAYTKYKTAVNIMAGFGGVASPYSYLHSGRTSLRTSPLL